MSTLPQLRFVECQREARLEMRQFEADRLVEAEESSGQFLFAEWPVGGLTYTVVMLGGGRQLFVADHEWVGPLASVYGLRASLCSTASGGIRMCSASAEQSVEFRRAAAIDLQAWPRWMRGEVFEIAGVVVVPIADSQAEALF